MSLTGGLTRGLSGGLLGLSGRSPSGPPDPLAGLDADDVPFVAANGFMWQDVARTTPAGVGDDVGSWEDARLSGKRFEWPGVIGNVTTKPVRTADGLYLPAGAGMVANWVYGQPAHQFLGVGEKVGLVALTAHRTLQSVGQNRLISLARTGLSAFGGGIVSGESRTDGAVHSGVLSSVGGGNYTFELDGTDYTTGSVANADWATLALARGGSLAEDGLTTVVRLLFRSVATSAPQRAFRHTWLRGG